MKKIIAIILSVVLVLALGTVAMAEQTASLSATAAKDGDTVTVTVKVNEEIPDCYCIGFNVDWDKETFEQGSISSPCDATAQWGHTVIVAPASGKLAAGETIAVLTFTAKDNYVEGNEYTFTLAIDPDNTMGNDDDLSMTGATAVLKETAPTEPPEPTAAPTAEPTAAPTAEPTAAPTAEPTAAPAEPTAAPAEPTQAPAEPTQAPAEPTQAPAEPTEAPAEATAAPTTAPTEKPTNPNNPKTGDESNIVLYFVIMVAALALGAVTFVVIRKGNKA